MKDASGHTIPIWMVAAEDPVRPDLRENMRADVCVVGAGIAGLTTAYLLAKEGRSVVVLDAGPIGGGETSRTTAHLATALDRRYGDLETLHGQKGSRLAAESHTMAIERIAEIAASEQIECDFEWLEGYLFLGPGDSRETLENELRAAHRAGLSQVDYVDCIPLKGAGAVSGLRFPAQAQFNPLKYLHALARAVERLGGRIFTDSHADRFESGVPCRVTTTRGWTVTAKDLVVATNTPVNELVSVHLKQAACRTYAIGVRVPAGSVARALYWDTGNPFHYVRLHIEADREVLIVGGEDHKTGQEEDTAARFSRLEAWMREFFPMGGEVEFRWSGQVIESIDGLAFIGRNSDSEPHIYIATGDSGNGMTHGTIAGMLLTDLIAGRTNSWTSLYSPTRLKLGAAAEFLGENANVAAHFLDHLTPGDRISTNEIGRGEGAVIRRGLSKIAAYRDVKGLLQEHSAVCPHMGCVVAWNSAETTWDCPCHGSRFDISGKVINGPSIGNLAPADNQVAGRAEVSGASLGRGSEQDAQVADG